MILHNAFLNRFYSFATFIESYKGEKRRVRQARKRAKRDQRSRTVLRHPPIAEASPHYGRPKDQHQSRGHLK